MAANLVVFKILFLILIAHTFSHFHSFSLAHQITTSNRNNGHQNLDSPSSRNLGVNHTITQHDVFHLKYSDKYSKDQATRSQQLQDFRFRRSASGADDELPGDLPAAADQDTSYSPSSSTASLLQDSEPNPASSSSSSSQQPDVAPSAAGESAPVVETAEVSAAESLAPESQQADSQATPSGGGAGGDNKLTAPNLISIATSESPSGDGATEQQVATSEGISSVAPSYGTTTTTTSIGSKATTSRFQRNKQQDRNEEGNRNSAAESGATSIAQLNYAELCYLSNGGSSLTLTVNEATQIGAVIGTIDVNGDPSLESGNVELMDLSLSPSPSTSANANQRGAGESTSESTGDTMTVPSSGSTLNSNAKLRRFPRWLWGPAAAATPLSPPPPQHPPVSQPDHEQPTSFYSIVSNGLVGGTSSINTNNHNQSPIRLEPGTRNLVLVRKLDKESSEGESSLLINIRCRPLSREHQAEATTIPVRILITDANDHAPEFIGGHLASSQDQSSSSSVNGQLITYQVNISETAPIGSIATREILAQDRDSAGPFSTLHYRVLDDGSPASRLLQFTNPLDPTLLVSGPLDYETLSSFVISITASDQGEPEPLSASAQVQVNVIDFDDQNPKFLDEKYSLVMDETQQSLVGQNLQVLPRNLYAEDGDKGIGAQILYSFDKTGSSSSGKLDSSDEGDEIESRSSSAAAAASGNDKDSQLDSDPSVNIERYLHLHPSSGEIRLLRQWPTAAATTSDSGGSKWTGAPMTLVVRAAQADNRDRYTLTTLTITTRPASGSSIGSGAGGAAGGKATGAGSAPLGIEFSPSRLTVNVMESVPINEKIARVKAKFSGKLAATTTTQSSLGISDQVVDLVQPQPVVSKRTGNAIRSQDQLKQQQQQQQQQVAGQRPINYQILDDQTDHFGINGVGEIFVKRPLDYELRQEFKFRVLATYTKYSDICQVQVNVLNVNDNKPKFSQPHYTFHLTESRLRSNLIGSIQAHDADLNDSINYSLAGDQAAQFEINSQGQISLRGNRSSAAAPPQQQLNMTQYMFTVQATDSLKSPNGNQNQHMTQARVSVHIAPQLIGRSLNLEPQGEAAATSKVFNSRSLDTNNLIKRKDQPQVAPSSQRSSVATIVASLQHMARSVNFPEMTMSSALLLSALLSFLVCLLFIVIISMSVHFIRRQTKSRRRRQLAAAHLRHAHMAARLHAAATGGPPLPPPNPQGDRRYRGGGSSGSSSSYDMQSHGSSPTNSTGAGSGGGGGGHIMGSGRQHVMQQQVAATQASAKHPLANQVAPLIKPKKSSPPPPTLDSGASNLTSSSSSSLLTTTISNQVARKSNQLAPKLTAKVAPSGSNSNLYKAITTSNANATTNTRNGAASRQSSHSGNSTPRSHVRSPLEVLSAQLSDTINQARQQQQQQHQQNHQSPQRTRHPSATPTQLSSISCTIGGQGCESSLISSLSSQSKRSYLSNITDDSSVMHCGHYSVQGAQAKSPLAADLGGGSSSNGRRLQTGGQLVRQSAVNMSQSPIEAAIESLVRGGKPIGSTTNDISGHNDLYSSPLTGSGKYADLRFSQQSQQEMAALTSSKPGIKSYRKLPLMGSLVRPVRQQFDHHQQQQHQPSELDNVDFDQVLSKGAYMAAAARGSGNNQDSAIVSDASSSGHSVVAQGSSGGGLVAIGKPMDSSSASIKWPNGSIPQRVKRLTWDDELSVAGLEVATGRLGEQNSQQQQDQNHQQYQYTSHLYDSSASHAKPQLAEQQQHFLFTSSPCSPALLSAGDLNSQISDANTLNRRQHNGGGSINGSLRPSQAQDGDSMMIMGQNNCLDYTIVRSSQFHVDSLAFENNGDTNTLSPLPPLAGGNGPQISANRPSNYQRFAQRSNQLGGFTMLGSQATFAPQPPPPMGASHQSAPLTTAVL